MSLVTAGWRLPWEPTWTRKQRLPHQLVLTHDSKDLRIAGPNDSLAIRPTQAPSQRPRKKKEKKKNTHKQGFFTVSFTPRCLKPPSCFYYLLTPWIITLNINRVEDKEMKPWPEVNVYTPYRILKFSLEFTSFQKLGRWEDCEIFVSFNSETSLGVDGGKRVTN